MPKRQGSFSMVFDLLSLWNIMCHQSNLTRSMLSRNLKFLGNSIFTDFLTHVKHRDHSFDIHYPEEPFLEDSDHLNLKWGNYWLAWLHLLVIGFTVAIFTMDRMAWYWEFPSKSTWVHCRLLQPDLVTWNSMLSAGGHSNQWRWVVPRFWRALETGKGVARFSMFSMNKYYTPWN